MKEQTGHPQPRRRGHGEGTIRQRADGRWEGRLTLATGKRYSVFGKTRQQVQGKLLDARQAQHAGTLLAPASPTLAQYLTRWLADTAALRVRPRTLQRYEIMVRKHIVPALGTVALAKLTPSHINRLYRTKLAEGLAPRTVLHLHRLLHCALRDAIRYGLLGRNVTEAVDPPRVSRFPIRPLSQADAQRLLVAADAEPLGALLTLALLTGAREGELLALRWEDIDWEHRQVHIQGTLFEGHILEPKTDRSRRTIALTDRALAALRRRRAVQAQARLHAGALWQERGLIFTTRFGTPLLPQNVLRRWYYPLLSRLGLPRIRFHDLRHTCASLLLAQRTPVKTVQETLGHASASTTLDIYGHLYEGEQRSALERLDALLG